ncbi:ribonuclease H-like domain-containing protein [Tanacetum coccineum]
MIDLCPLNYFLGISATRTTSGIFLPQTKYATEILERAQMLNCNPCRTPVDIEKKLGPEGSPVTDPTLYRSIAGALQYLTFTRPDLSYIVQQLCFPATHWSTSGYCVFLGNNLLAWSSKRQDMLSRSSTEAEYRGVANALAETSWIRNLLRELHTSLSQRPWSTVIMQQFVQANRKDGGRGWKDEVHKSGNNNNKSSSSSSWNISSSSLGGEESIEFVFGDVKNQDDVSKSWDFFSFSIIFLLSAI